MFPPLSLSERPYERDSAHGLDLSEKNPLETLPHDATVVSLLGVFARGAHRGEIYTCSNLS